MHKKTFGIEFITEAEGGIIRRIAKEIYSQLDSFSVVGPYLRRIARVFPFVLKTNFLWGQKKPFKEQIVYFLPYTYWDDRLVLGRKSVALLTHFEEGNEEKVKAWHKAINGASKLVAISNFVKMQAVEQGYGHKNIEVLPYGISAIYAPTLNVLVVGRPGNRKGIDFLLETTSNISQSVNVEFRCVGDGWPIRSLKVPFDDLRLAYGWCDILFVPSGLEGGHTPTVEALAMGKEVLTRAVGWSAFELAEIVNTVDSPLEASKFISILARKKIEVASPKTKFTAQFSYSNWTETHLQIFNSL